jgi:hypothetical protein
MLLGGKSSLFSYSTILAYLLVSLVEHCSHRIVKVRVKRTGRERRETGGYYM